MSNFTFKESIKFNTRINTPVAIFLLQQDEFSESWSAFFIGAILKSVFDDAVNINKYFYKFFNMLLIMFYLKLLNHILEFISVSRYFIVVVKKDCLNFSLHQNLFDRLVIDNFVKKLQITGISTGILCLHTVLLPSFLCLLWVYDHFS